jgi:demethylmenaquinone methyltransferase/2-methoxy-6-polyprenyl-1,4-benzoquinol methylase
MLAVLAGHVRQGGRVLEIGTGTGVATAWVLSGLGTRYDVTVTTIERDAQLGALARQADWPSFVDPRVGDVLELVHRLGRFDLIYAKAESGKLDGLSQTIGALDSKGLLVLDEMAAQPNWEADRRAKTDKARQIVLMHPALTAVELAHGSGMVLACRIPE